MSEQAICTDWAELYFSAIFLHGYCTCMLLACLGWDLQKGADLFRSTPTEDRSLLSLVRAEFGKSGKTGKNCLSFQKIQSFPCTRTWNSYVTGFLRYFYVKRTAWSEDWARQALWKDSVDTDSLIFHFVVTKCPDNPVCLGQAADQVHHLI